MKIVEIMRKMAEVNASDLHITAGSPPQIRVDGDLVPVGDKPLSPEESRELSCSVLTEKQKSLLESGELMELDFSFGIHDIGRFRANVHYQRGSVGLALRCIPYKVPTIEELNLPDSLKILCDKPKGLVLITGATGNGKSTTTAAMIDRVNTRYKKHIITIEDPIEFLHRNKKSLITQREVGQDTFSFHDALRTILRQDPDVVLIGEMRDLETIKATLTIAETGHLTMATLHTNSTVETVNRIIDAFPSAQQSQVRAQLSFVLEGVVCQQLIPKADGKGRALAMEIMFPNPAIRNLIREGKTHQIYSNMQTSQTETNMQTMAQSLANLYRNGDITEEECLQRSPDQKEIKRLMELDGSSTEQKSVAKKKADYF